MIPEVGVHDGKLIMLEARGKSLITIKRLRPSIANEGGRRVMLCSGIPTGGGGRDERVQGG